MEFLVVQALSGLASAASLFLVASGLSIIFGVTRIVNFAHGAFYMLGAYAAVSLANAWAGPLGFWAAIVLAAIVVAVFGILVEMVLLRRIYQAPELFQLLATFGVTLIVEDAVVLLWGAEDLLGPRAPGFRGAVTILGQQVPTYDLLLIALGPIVLGLLGLLFYRTRFGVLVRAATQDREMVAALGVNQRWLFTGVFGLGVFLAALGGALQIPRTTVTHTMDLTIIVEVFVVVVIGGLGSVLGAFIAALIVAELNAFGILVMPGISLVLVFLVMAAVLIVRPWGLLGSPEVHPRAAVGQLLRPWRRFTVVERVAIAAALLGLALLPLFVGGYTLSVASEILIAVLFASSLHFLMSVAGLISFGHAAFFGLGAYGAALAVKGLGVTLATAVVCGSMLAFVAALALGPLVVRLSGVYFAMLTLAIAQILWSIAFQWVSVTGGDNGLLGLWPPPWLARPERFFWFVLALTAGGVAIMRMLMFSPFGYAVRAVRDSALKAEAIGLDRSRLQWAAFAVAGLFAGLAGALFVFLKGSVFPDILNVPTSVDALVMVLLGGVETASGAIAGAVVYKALAIWLMSQTAYSKLILGSFIVLIVLAFPKGIMGFAGSVGQRLGARRAGPAAKAGER